MPSFRYLQNECLKHLYVVLTTVWILHVALLFSPSLLYLVQILCSILKTHVRDLFGGLAISDSKKSVLWWSREIRCIFHLFIVLSNSFWNGLGWGLSDLGANLATLSVNSRPKPFYLFYKMIRSLFQSKFIYILKGYFPWLPYCFTWTKSTVLYKAIKYLLVSLVWWFIYINCSVVWWIESWSLGDVVSGPLISNFPISMCRGSFVLFCLGGWGSLPW